MTQLPSEVYHKSEEWLVTKGFGASTGVGVSNECLLKFAHTQLSFCLRETSGLCE